MQGSWCTWAGAAASLYLYGLIWTGWYELEALDQLAILRLEAAGEEAENFWLIYPLKAADVMSSLIQLDDSVSYVVKVLSLIHI